MDLSKARARRERIRLQKRNAAKKGPEPAPDFDPYATERATGLISRLIGDREFSSEDEVNAFLEENVRGRKLEEIEADLPQDHGLSDELRAQELAYEAMNQTMRGPAERLARQALAIDPTCVDALCVLADHLPTPGQRAAELRRIVTSAEESFGADFMRDNKGHFWGLNETRPYMRARFHLALALGPVEGLEAAIREMVAILELNPNDNQGVRELLVPIALLDDRELAGRLLNEMFADEESALMNWSRFIYWLLAPDVPKALRALHAARQQNPHVEKYLTGKKKPPAHLPAMIQWGGESEAAQTAFQLAAIIEGLPELRSILSTIPKKLPVGLLPDPIDPTRIH